MRDPGEHLLTHRAPSDLLARVHAQQKAEPQSPRWRTPVLVAAAFFLGVFSGQLDRLSPEPPAATAQAPVVDALTPVRLVFHTDQADSVGVAGSWNSWEPEPMQATESGMYFTIVALPPGRHEYMFVLNETEWISDPTALITQDDGFGQKNAVLQVGT